MLYETSDLSKLTYTPKVFAKPDVCEHAGESIHFTKSTKTYCEAMKKWTNCKEVGHCTKE